MKNIIIRGRTLSFKRAPESINDADSYEYNEDGALLIQDGKIVKSSSYNNLKANNINSTKVYDHNNKLIMSGFIDPHLHFPQIQIIGSYASNLLEWLNKYTFNEEQKFSDQNHTEEIAKIFFDELINNGTTTAASFCTTHKNSVDSFFSESQKRDMLMIGGKIMMDRNAPSKLLDTPQKGYDDTKELIKKWDNNGRQYYAITPRFAITSSPNQLEITKALTKEHPSCFIQTHLAENIEEISLTKKLFPKFNHYTEIYQKYDLLGKKTLLGHCVHLSEREISIIKEANSVAVFCPTSNLFLGSGLFNFNELSKKFEIRKAVATDIGGGTSINLLKTMDEAYKILQLQNQRLTPLESFYQITLGNAAALSLEEKIGNLDNGSDADIVVLDSRATKAMDLRMKNINNLVDELFILQTMGDDRSIDEVYIKGKPVKKIKKN